MADNDLWTACQKVIYIVFGISEEEFTRQDAKTIGFMAIYGSSKQSIMDFYRNNHPEFNWNPQTITIEARNAADNNHLLETGSQKSPGSLFGEYAERRMDKDAN